MGLTIHYKGRLKSPECIDSLIAEVGEIAAILGWEQKVISDEQVKGVVTAPENCEPIWLTFLHDGTLVSLSYLHFNIESNGWVATKTQYAGMEAHITVIKLLRYLSEKYFGTFELNDEGHYWETNDEAVLRENFRQYNAMLDRVAGALENFETRPGETKEDMAGRLEEFLKERMSGHTPETKDPE